METPAQQADRLLRSLEEQVEQEGMYLQGGFYDLAVETRRRAEPLVLQLASLAGQPGVEAWHGRITALMANNQRHDLILRGKIADLAAEIQRIDQARHRTAQVAPAYAGVADRLVARFSAAG